MGTNPTASPCRASGRAPPNYPSFGFSGPMGDAAPAKSRPHGASPLGYQARRLPASSFSFRRLSTAAEVGPLGL